MSSSPAAGPDETPWSIATISVLPPRRIRRNRISFPIEDMVHPCESVARTGCGGRISSLRSTACEIWLPSNACKKLHNRAIVPCGGRQTRPCDYDAARSPADLLQILHGFFLLIDL